MLTFGPELALIGPESQRIATRHDSEFFDNGVGEAARRGEQLDRLPQRINRLGKEQEISDEND